MKQKVLTSVDIPLEESITRLLKDVKKYTIIGESHIDYTVIQLVSELIDSNKFSSIFLEPLRRGNYREMGEQLLGKLEKVRSKKMREFYKNKYNTIIERALEKGLSVYGIDSWGRRKSNEEYYWAEYILEQGETSNLILVGSMHLDFWRSPSYHPVLPTYLVSQGVAPEDILTVATNELSYHGKIIPTGLYKLEELPDNTNDIQFNIHISSIKRNMIADYVLVIE